MSAQEAIDTLVQCLPEHMTRLEASGIVNAIVAAAVEARVSAGTAPLELDTTTRVSLTDRTGRETLYHCESCGWPLRGCDQYALDEDRVAVCKGCAEDMP